jgi:hypothetical protein
VAVNFGADTLFQTLHVYNFILFLQKQEGTKKQLEGWHYQRTFKEHQSGIDVLHLRDKARTEKLCIIDGALFLPNVLKTLA